MDTKFRSSANSYSALGAGTTKLAGAGIGLTQVQGRINEIKARMELEQEKTNQRLNLIAQAGKLASKFGEGLDTYALANKMAKEMGIEDKVSIFDALFNPNKHVGGIPISTLATTQQYINESGDEGARARMLEALNVLRGVNRPSNITTTASTPVVTSRGSNGYVANQMEMEDYLTKNLPFMLSNLIR